MRDGCSNWRDRVTSRAFYRLRVMGDCGRTHMSRSGGEGIKGTAVLSGVLDKIKEQLEGSWLWTKVWIRARRGRGTKAGLTIFGGVLPNGIEINLPIT